MTTLMPGDYLLELEFARPVTAKVLGQVMAGFGFSKAVPDQMPEAGVVIGALKQGALGVPANPTAPRAPVTPVKASAAATPATSSKPRMTAYTAPSVTTTAPAIRKVAITHDPYKDDPYKGGQDLRRPSPPPAKASIAPSLRPTLKAVEKKAPSFLPGGGAFPGGGGGGAPPGPTVVIDRAALDNILRDPNLDPADLEALAAELEAEGFKGEAAELRARAAQLRAARPAPSPDAPSPDVPGGNGFVPLGPRKYMEETAATSPGGMFADLPSPLVTLQGLWQAWRDYGNPFHGMASISGTATRSEEGRVRLIARLDHPLELKNTKDVTWISVTPLGLDPFVQVSQTLTPYQLETGRAYEARFISRTKKAPSRDAVLRLLSSMGFSPVSLSAIKRDMRFPGRPGANLVLWHGVVRWDGPPSMIVADDPLYFSEMRALSTI